MRNTALLLGFVGITACSVDHIVVAALDNVSAAGAFAAGAGGSTAAGGEGARPADAGASAGLGGEVALGGGGSRGEAEAGGFSITWGGAVGSAVLLDAAGAGGATTEIRCSCLGQQAAQVCGTDGLTYPAECGDAGPCLPPAIDCFHACPCLDAGVGGMAEASWFPLECAATAPCSDVVCMMFSNVRDTPTLCATTN
jgi:hypothetical protein